MRVAMESATKEQTHLSPVERLRQRLSHKLRDLHYGLEKLDQDGASDTEWTRLIYQQHIENCQNWLKAIERVG